MPRRRRCWGTAPQRTPHSIHRPDSAALASSFHMEQPLRLRAVHLLSTTICAVHRHRLHRRFTNTDVTNTTTTQAQARSGARGLTTTTVVQHRPRCTGARTWPRAPGGSVGTGTQPEGASLFAPPPCTPESYVHLWCIPLVSVQAVSVQAVRCGGGVCGCARTTRRVGSMAAWLSSDLWLTGRLLRE